MWRERQHKSAGLPSLRGTTPDQGQKRGTRPDYQNKLVDDRGDSVHPHPAGHIYIPVSWRPRSTVAQELNPPRIIAKHRKQSAKDFTALCALSRRPTTRCSQAEKLL
jgi:hypothetical protein